MAEMRSEQIVSGGRGVGCCCELGEKDSSRSIDVQVHVVVDSRIEAAQLVL
jgi:hypothetical protein